MTTWPLPALTDLYVQGEGWRNVSEDVRLETATSGGGITITRGKQNEGSRTQAGQADYVWNNRHGHYSPSNPRSELYGKIGRNSPVRTGIRVGRDTFQRTSVNGWGAMTSGPVWTTAGGATGFAVAAGVATHTHTVANAIRYTTTNQQFLDLEQLHDISVSQVATGASLVAGVTARRQPVTGWYYWFRLEFNVGGTTTLKISKFVNGAHTELAATLVGTYTAGSIWRFRTSVAGGHLACSVWDPAGPEPITWQLTTSDTELRTPGAPGTQTWAVSGNSNSARVFSYRNYEQINRRWWGEIPSFPSRWDLSEKDRWVPLEAAGILRRLGQGAKPLDCALTRAHKRKSPRAWWPLTDGEHVTEAQSGIPGQPAMNSTGMGLYNGVGGHVPGTVTFGVTGDRGTTSLVSLVGGGQLHQRFPSTITTSWTFESVALFTAGTSDGGSHFFVSVHDEAAKYEWTLGVSGDSIYLAAGAIDGSVVGGSKNPGLTATLRRLPQYRLDVRQNGTGVDHVLYLDGANVGSFTWTSFTIPPMGQATANSYLQDGDPMPSVGQFAFYAPALSPFDLETRDAAWAWEGEDRINRFRRLCGEELVECSVLQSFDEPTVQMGLQRPRTFLELLGEIEDLDGGILRELRAALGLELLTQASLYNQPAVEVSYADGHISAPFWPDEDDQGITNDVTVNRVGGSSSQSVQLTGPLSILPPGQGGIGTYESKLDVVAASDSQLPDIANWRRFLGTVDAPRYSSIHVDLSARAYDASPDLTAQVSALDSGLVQQINDLPDSVPPGPAKAMIQGYTETLDAFDWDITFVASPGSPYDVAEASDPALAADEEEPRGCVDYDAGDTHTLTTGINATALSFQVSFLISKWEVDAADFPLIVNLDGEWIRVSAISGSTSPQTFTVPSGGRSVNGIVKSHLAGVPVDVAYPAIAGS